MRSAAAAAACAALCASFAVGLPSSQAAQPMFRAAAYTKTTGAPVTIVGADVDTDGDADLVVSYDNTSPGSFADEVLLAEGSGFKVSRLPLRATDLVAADLNADGSPDLVASLNGRDRIAVLLGKGRGRFARPVQHPTLGTQPQALAVADFDRDGDLDVAVGNYGSDDVGVLLGDGAGGFAPPTRFEVGYAPRELVAVDLNADGAAELVIGQTRSVDDRVYASRLTVAVNDGAGGFTAPAPTEMTGLHRLAGAGDTDADGRPDVVLSGDDVQILRGNGKGGLGPTRPVKIGCPSSDNGPFACNPGSVAVGDLSGDGRADLVVNYPIGRTLRVLIARPGGRFAKPVDLGFRARVRAGPVAIADVNGDCAPDLVHTADRSLAINLSTRQVACSKAKSPTARLVGSAAAPAAGPAHKSVLVADLDRDGAPDLLAGRHETRDLSVRLNTSPLARLAGLVPR